MSTKHIAALVSVSVLLVIICKAQVPAMFNYQGKLVHGTNLVNAATTMVFRLYNTASGGDPLYIETQEVVVVDSLYSTHIGESPEVGSLANAVTNQPLFLELQIGDTTLSPREQVVSVLYAIKAGGVTAGAITQAMLADEAVTRPKIAPRAVSSAEIALGTVSYANIEDDTIRSNKIDWAWMPSGLQDGDDDSVLASYRESGAFGTTPSVSGVDSIAQGEGAVVAGDYAVVSGGKNNTASDTYGTVGGGAGNNAGYRATVGGGLQNLATAKYSAVLGGQYNSAKGEGSTVCGGGRNTNQAFYATISGGSENLIRPNSTNATIGGGAANHMWYDSARATIGGGGDNKIGGAEYATISGGRGNTVAQRAHYALISGGRDNEIQHYSDYAAIGGGSGNIIEESATNSTIGGGSGNNIDENAGNCVIAGGVDNQIGLGASFATVSGGRWNEAHADYSTVSGGSNNVVYTMANNASIGGGGGNVISIRSGHSTISGGRSNLIKSVTSYGTIGGGVGNVILTNCHYSTISGGAENQIGSNTHFAVIGGGWGNRVLGKYGTVPGGGFCKANGLYSLAAGKFAVADHSGSFVWGDGQNLHTTSSVANEVTFRCAGGARFLASTPTANRVTWDGGSSGWQNFSDQTAKEDFLPIDEVSVLERVVGLPITEWNYKGYSKRHIGPMAQDFHAAFPLAGSSDTSIDSGDLHGVALAAIQGLHAEVSDQKSDVGKLQEENRKLKHRVGQLEDLVRSLSKGGQQE
ncbi:MAG: tail fiber domain-containing protein [Verrucomicrobia bacterium]|nr:tail fiber domain-containing protein [Verrucomicrobiota bacterium]